MAFKFQDYYEILGVNRNCSKQQLTHAYRQLARKRHPDVNKDPGAEEQFKQLNEAYEVLKDPEKRKRYNTLGANWKAGQEFTPPPGFENAHFEFRTGTGGNGFDFRPSGQFSDFFQMLFGQSNNPRGRTAGPGVDIDEMLYQMDRDGGPTGTKPTTKQSTITISLEDAYLGTTRRITLEGPKGRSNLDVKIPPGTTAGSKIRLNNGANGHDIFLKVNIAPHPQFTLTGHDLTTELCIAPWEAALGAKVPIHTLDGHVTLTIPAGTDSDRRLRLGEMGLPRRKGNGRGDLFVRVKIVIPKILTAEEQILYEQLKGTSEFDPRQ